MMMGPHSNTDHPLVSIIVTHWNDEATTEKCLHCVSDSTFAVKAVILVDSGSTDGSGEKLLGKFPWVKSVRLHRNLGHTVAVNAGATLAAVLRSKYLLLLDNDAFLEQDCLSILLERLEAEPAAAVACPLILSGRKQGRIWYAGGRVTPLGNSEHLHMGRKVDEVRLNICSTGFVSSCAMLIRRQVFELVGGLNELLSGYSEDLDLSIKVRRAGHTLLFVPEARATHGESVNVIKVAGKSFRDYYTMRNRLYVIRTYGDGFQRIFGIPLTIAWYGVAYGLAHLLRGEVKRGIALYRGTSDFLAGRMGWRNL